MLLAMDGLSLEAPTMTKLPCLVATAFALGLLAAQPAIADERWHEHGGPHHHEGWEHWREGHWIHAWREGRDGWWWVLGPNWYFYPAPIYPYPEPPVVVVTPPPQIPPQYAYYCPNPAGYYPTLPQCPMGWQLVPLAPAAPIAPPR